MTADSVERVSEAILLSLLLLVNATVAGLAETPHQPQANDTLEDTRREIEDLLDDQSDLYDQLVKIELKLDESSKAQRHCRKQIKRLDSEIAEVERILRGVRDSLSHEHSLFAYHLTRLHQQLRLQNPSPLILDPGSQQVLRHRFLLSHLLAADREYMESLCLQAEEYQEMLATLVSKQAELETLRSARREEERNYQESLVQREKLLATLKREQRQKMTLLTSLEQSTDLLGEIVNQLEEQKDTALLAKERELVSRLRGRLHWPVRGQLRQSFGVKRDPVTNLATKCSGIKIATNRGTKVVAALTGEVVYIGWARGLESFIVVDHGGRVYSLYGNLGQIKVKEGEQLVRGQPFATAAGDQLHFEIRQGKEAVDPLDWLRP